jgi:hypothetical protein
MICGGQVTVLQPPLCIKQVIFNAKINFTLKVIFLIQREGKGTVSVLCISELYDGRPNQTTIASTKT